jgi:hypothetical protein
MRKLAIPLLAIYLIVAGLLPLIKVDLPFASLIISVLAIAAGVLLLLGGAQFRSTRNLGSILLAIWLILVGILPLLNISFPSQDILLALLGIAAGVLLLLRR